KPTSIAVTKPNGDYVARYLDEVAPASLVGRLLKYSKDGKFFTPDDEQEIADDQDFIALCDETLVGWVKFNGPGQPPDRVMGLLYGGFTMPKRGELGDTDERKWEKGLDGEPADPWQHQIYLVLQQAGTRQLFPYVADSKP